MRPIIAPGGFWKFISVISLILVLPASAQHSVARGILFLSCSSVRLCMRLCVRPKTLLTRYLAEYLTHFTKITSTIHYGTEMNTSQFGVKIRRSRSR